MVQQRILIGFVGGGIRLAGTLVALTRTGTVVRCSEDLEPGTTGRLGITDGHEIVRIGAVVRRRIPRLGLHFKFVKMTSVDRDKLRQLLHQLARSPSA